MISKMEGIGRFSESQHEGLGFRWERAAATNSCVRSNEERSLVHTNVAWVMVER